MISRAEKRRETRSEKRAESRYERMKEQARARNAQAALCGRDIGHLPKVENPDIKEMCRVNFRLFCETYFPELFELAFSSDHLKVIHRIECAVLQGGLFALAMPRGSGKTTLCECAVIWATIYGHRQFVALIGATQDAAEEMLASIKTSLETNDRLGVDFPEVCFPIAKLDGITNRANGQLCGGKRTRIKWNDDVVVLPSIDGSSASGAIIRVAGITGRVRGMKHKRPDGVNVRPSLVIIDDPQDDESAHSEKQIKVRVRVLSRDILGLAGPGKKIAGVMPCTVIAPDDMADQILDQEKHPEWNGERCKMVYEFPKNEELWEKYAEIWAESLRIHHDIREATEFYRKNRAAMDEGAHIAWPERYEPDELSAVQNAMNLKIKDAGAFFAEYQNEPQSDDENEAEQLKADDVATKLNGYKLGAVPVECNTVTMFIDIHEKLLFWSIIAWSDTFTGYILDYGTFPDQKKQDFTLSDARYTLGGMFPEMGREDAIYKALDELTKWHMMREFIRDDGARLQIARCLIDANWGQTTDVIYQFCRQSEFAVRLYPSHGKGITASGKPMTEYRRKPGERLGLNWYIPTIKGKKRVIRYVMFDANWWKSFIAQRFKTGMGAVGCLSFWGRNSARHKLIAAHICAEGWNATEGNGRRVEEWKMKPGASDNHWLDCIVGNAVAASIEGVSLPGTEQQRPKKKEKRIIPLPSY